MADLRGADNAVLTSAILTLGRGLVSGFHPAVMALPICCPSADRLQPVAGATRECLLPYSYHAASTLWLATSKRREPSPVHILVPESTRGGQPNPHAVFSRYAAALVVNT